jgi:hypothetical protein
MKFDLLEERVFTRSDLVALFRRHQRKLKIAALLGAFFLFSYSFVKSPKYKASATFKEAIESNSSGNLLKELFVGVGSASSPSEAIIGMKSSAVLRPLIEELGLQANVAGSHLLVRLMRNIWEHWTCIRGHRLQDIKQIQIRHLKYEGEVPYGLTLQVNQPSSFTVTDATGDAVQGAVGVPLNIGPVQLTITHIPPCHPKSAFAITIQPWLLTIQTTRSQLIISPQKANPSISDISCIHRDRHLASEIVNQLIFHYQQYLKRSYDYTVTQQLTYLKSKQQELLNGMRAALDAHVDHLKHNLSQEGLLLVETQAGELLAPYQVLKETQRKIQAELLRLDTFDLQNPQPFSLGEGNFSSQFTNIFSAIGHLQQQKDLMELSMHRSTLAPEDLYGASVNIEQLNQTKETLHQLITFLATHIPQELPEATHLKSRFDDPRFILNLSQLSQPDALNYLQEKMRLLLLQEKLHQERLIDQTHPHSTLENLDLETARALFVHYQEQMDASETLSRSYEEFKLKIQDPDFPLTSIGSLLSDPISQNLIQRASQLALQLQDEKHRTSKEQQRWKEELLWQKGVLKEHIEQMLRVELITQHLLKEKIQALQAAGLDSINRKLLALQEELKNLVQSERIVLEQEHALLEQQMNLLRESFASLADKWRSEKWCKLQTEMATKMMAGISELVESKTIAYHMHHIESKALDLAAVPLLPNKPNYLARALLGAMLATSLAALYLVLRQVIQGFPVSVDLLKAINYPIAGPLSSQCEIDELAPDNIEVLRTLSLFIKSGPQLPGRVISVIGGRAPHFGKSLAHQIGQTGTRPLIIDLPLTPWIAKASPEGLLQALSSSREPTPWIQHFPHYDHLPSGGYHAYAAEWIQSPLFQNFIHQQKHTYPLVLLWLAVDIQDPAAKVTSLFSDQVILTLQEEKASDLVEWAKWGCLDRGWRLHTLLYSP